MKQFSSDAREGLRSHPGPNAARWLRAIIVLCLGLLVAAGSSAADTAPDLLTPAERAWLVARPPIVLGAANDWAVNAKKDPRGGLSGPFVEYLDLMNQRLATDIRIEAGPWHEMVRKAEAGEIDGLALTAPLEERTKHFLFTDVFTMSPDFIYLRTDDLQKKGAPADLAGLHGKRVGYGKGSLRTSRALAIHPEITPVPHGSFATLVEALLRGELDAVVAPYALEYWRASNGVVGMAITRIVHEIDASMVMSINKEEPELVGILNKGIAAITRDELEPIYRRWFGPDYSDRVAALRVRLNADERAWLVDHPVLQAGINPAWAPVEFIDDTGVARGIAPAYLDRLGKMLGVRFEIAAGLSGAEVLKRAGERELDVVPATAETPERLEQLILTAPYASFPAAIFSAADVAYLGGLESLEGKLVAVVKDEAVHSWLRREWPELALLPVQDTREALKKVAGGQAFAFIGNLVTTSYYIGQTGLTQIKVAGETPFVYRLSMGVRKDWPILAGILQKGLAAIPATERDAIYREWISVQHKSRIDYSLVWKVIAWSAVIVFVVFLWNRRLAAEVSRRRRAEAAYREAQEAAERANQAKSIFLANMCHELRTPLNAVLGFASLLETAGLDDEKRRAHLATLSTAGRGLRQLVDDLLDLSRAEAGKLELRPKPVDLRALLSELQLMFGRSAAEKGLALDVAVADQVPHALRLDPVRLRQILVNLVGNAIKFTEAGRVEVLATGDTVEGNGFQLEVAVTDTGIGIPPEHYETVFEFFNQRPDPGVDRYGGAGLGLSISRRLARLMGGDIRIEPPSERGSRFVLALPAVMAAEHACSPSPDRLTPDVAPTFAPARILIADDDSANRELLLAYLSEYEFELVEAGDGAQALQEVGKRAPDLILMDIAMPVLDGLAAARRLKADPGTAGIPIVAVTAAVTEEREQEIRSLFAACLLKPVSGGDLVGTLARYLPRAPDSRDATPSTSPEASVSVAGGMGTRLSPALHRQLQSLRPPFASLNDIETFARQLDEEGSRTGDSELGALAARIRRQVGDLDIAGLERSISGLKAAATLAA